MGDEADYLYEQMLMNDLMETSQEHWYRLNYLQENIWLTKDYVEIPIENMEDDHIVNCINFLKREGPSSFYGTGREWIVKFNNELKRRNKYKW